MRFAQSCVIRFRGLDTLCKGASVGDTGKRAGNDFGVIHITHPDEQAVFLTEVLVHSDIELIGVVAENGVSSEVVKEPGIVGNRIKVQQLDRIRIEPAGGDYVSWKRLANESDLTPGGHWGTPP